MIWALHSCAAIKKYFKILMKIWDSNRKNQDSYQLEKPCLKLKNKEEASNCSSSCYFMQSTINILILSIWQDCENGDEESTKSLEGSESDVKPLAQSSPASSTKSGPWDDIVSGSPGSLPTNSRPPSPLPAYPESTSNARPESSFDFPAPPPSTPPSSETSPSTNSGGADNQDMGE